MTRIPALFVKRFDELTSTKWPIEAAVHDILDKPLERRFDALYSLDVMEHIKQEKESINEKRETRNEKLKK